VLTVVSGSGGGASPSARDSSGGPRPRHRDRQTSVTVIVLGVWAVTSGAAGWLSGWRRADPRLLRRLLVWLGKVVSPAAAR
jgi:hypothetical protein